ncbi:hypothetical protein MUK42_23634 [Musa troglodytarum]|uniref:Protein NEGATIVE REGULATOR OF RESISTANCE n=1 Tax=Musa troglodytarum TaxID=320322 RepID=A0A9E7GDZ9_9LILI|nr:hypothetical protein MUK42_23634 [Musa troglodytarum]
MNKQFGFATATRGGEWSAHPTILTPSADLRPHTNRKVAASSSLRLMDSSSKRKRRSGDDEPRPSKPRAASGDDPQATDDEVEEFFAILRRMRDASRSIATATAGGGARSDARPQPPPPPLPPPAGPRWSPEFALEDFQGDGLARDGGAADTVAEDSAAKPSRCLDLNADPEPEGLAAASPRGEATARCAPFVFLTTRGCGALACRKLFFASFPPPDVLREDLRR